MDRLMQTMSEVWGALAQNVPGLMTAMLVLAVGTIVAWAAALVVRMGVHRLELNKRLGTGKKDSVDAERWVSRGAFWLGFSITLLFFLNQLKISAITEPMNRFMGGLYDYMPRLIGGIALMLVAWGVAYFLKRAAVAALDGAKLHEKIGKRIGLQKQEANALTRSVPDAVYWIVLLLFLPAVLGVLAIEGLLGPVEDLTSTVVGFLPNLLAAAVILIAGWVLARILRGITVGVTSSLGADQLSDRIGVAKMLGDQKLSAVVGTVVYVLVLIPVLIAALNALQLESITAPASAMLASVLGALPGVFSAVLILTLAYIVGRVLANMATSVLKAAGADNLIERIGLGTAPKPGQRTLSEVTGTLLLVAIMLFAGIEAMRQLGFEAMAALMTTFTVFGGKVVVALVIFGVGLYLGGLANSAVRASGSTHAAPLGQVARASIVILATAVGLQHLGVGQDIIKLAFAILLGAVAVAAAIAFGIGGRDVAAGYLKEWTRADRSRAKATNGRRPARARTARSAARTARR